MHVVHFVHQYQLFSAFPHMFVRACVPVCNHIYKNGAFGSVSLTRGHPPLALLTI